MLAQEKYQVKVTRRLTITRQHHRRFAAKLSAVIDDVDEQSPEGILMRDALRRRVTHDPIKVLVVK